MKNLLNAVVAIVIAACGSDDTCSSDACEVDAGCATDCPTCGDGACNADETPATCAADCVAGGPVCGDGTCNGTETPMNCASDCGTPACTAANDTCTGETICISGACEPAFPRTYVVTDVMVSLPMTNMYGQPWDADNSAPDLFLADSNGMNPMTAIAPNVYSTRFAGPFEYAFTSTSELRVDVWDSDPEYSPPFTRELVFSCNLQPVQAAFFRPRTWGCAYNNATLTLTINPK